MKRFVVPLLLTPLAALPGQAGVSFDCAKARSGVERAICADATLSDLDGEIADSYRAALSRVGAHPGARAILVETQRTFVQDRNLGFSKGYGMMAHMRAQSDFLRRAAAGEARDGFLGRWETPRGYLTVHGAGDGRLSIEAQASEQTAGRWVCQWGDESNDRVQGAPARMEGDALVSGDRSGWSLRLTRDGPMLRLEEVAPGGSSGVQPDHCGRNGTLSGAYFAVAPAAARAPAAPPAAPRDKSIADHLRLLPVSAFDDTTDGLAESEKAALLAKGETENWRMKIVTAAKAVFTARRGSSEVTATTGRLDGKDTLQVLTRNERAVAYAYFDLSADGATLARLHPKVIVRAANETADGSAGVPFSAIPYELVEHVESRDACHHWGGEISGDNSARDKEVARKMAARKCDRLAANEQALRSKYVRQPLLLGVLDRAGRMIGE